MLIICNGAIKSGSTWLYNILTQLVDCQHPPEQYLTGRSEKSPCIKPELLSSFLDVEDYVNNNYITKNHLSSVEHRDLIKSRTHVFLFDIERDPKDVVVSNYYHDCFRNGYKGDFKQYYWENGRYVASQLSYYHNLWRDQATNFYISSYERLHNEFPKEVEAISAVLCISLTPQEIDSIMESTSLGTLRKDYQDDARYQGDKFFRKGVVGDWRNHFDSKMLKDIERIETCGIHPFDVRKLFRQAKQRFGR